MYNGQRTEQKTSEKDIRRLKEVSSHLFLNREFIMIRVLSMNNIMKLLRKMEELHNEKLIIEFTSDHGGCIKSASTYDIKAAWNDLEQFNELVKEHCYVRPNRPSK